MFKARRSAAPAALLAVSLVLTACGGNSQNGKSGPADTLVYGVDGEPDTLDPHVSSFALAALFTRPVLDSLVYLDDKGKVHPWLANSWQISPDGKTYTFKLRHGVKFSDGTPFNAAAVKANLDRIVDPKTKSALAAAQIAPYKSTKVVDEYTAKVSLSKPYSPFLAALGTAFTGMQSPAALKKGPDFTAKTVVGTGPFVMDEYTPHRQITYHRNKDYNWAPKQAKHQGPAHLKHLTYKILTEDAVRYGALTSGQVDAIAALPPSSLKQAKQNPDLKVQTRDTPGENYSYYPNITKGVFTDVRVRKAFRNGIDFKSIIDRLYFGAYAPALGPLSPTTPGYDKGTEKLWGYDPDEAGRLLDEAGWTGHDKQGYRTKNGKRLTVRWLRANGVEREQRGTLAEQIQASAKKIGFDVQMPAGTLNEYIQRFGKADYDLVDFSLQRPDGDVLRNVFDTSNISDGTKLTQNGARYSDPQVDGWLDAALKTTDLTERADLYAKVQRKVTNEAVVFPAYVFSYIMGLSKNVEGISWDAMGHPTFYDAQVSQN